MRSSLARKERVVSASLGDLVDRVNGAFSRMAAQLGLCGCVGLIHDGGSFGAEVLIQFKDTLGLSRLRHDFHSGGEKSVCTALYLMALQETKAAVPVTWVDEINQGQEERLFRLL